MTFDEANQLRPGDRIVLDFWDRDQQRHLPTPMHVRRIEVYGTECVHVFPAEITYSVEHTLIGKA